jgi:DNA replicative helicase MCM subunit Mcm2 (Cdc46/Mcm family)
VQVLLAYYQSQRRAEQRSQARTTIRMLESLVRVSQVRAACSACLGVAGEAIPSCCLLVSGAAHSDALPRSTLNRCAAVYGLC